MRTGRFAPALAAAAALVLSSPVFGQSVTISGPVTLIYDPLTERTESFLVTSRMPNGHPVLNYYLTAETRLNKRYFGSGKETIQYQIYDGDVPGSRNIVMSGKEAGSSSDVATGMFPSNTPVRESTRPLYLTVTPSPGSFMSAGIYSASIPIDLWSGTFSVKKSSASATVTANLIVNEILTLSVVADGASLGSAELSTFDLGGLVGSVEFRADLYALANTGYKIDLKSANGGVLRYADPNYPDAGIVDYALYVGTSSTEVPLAPNTPALIASSGTGTGWKGQKYDLRIVVPDFSQNEDMPTAGLYTDTLTVTIAKN
jgi:spore coat protein U-like protein